ncbi:hypothetical protein Pelo_12972 [Pelomyxa schiedti]|nr:hypothetical protein Pelo_12972 [Pelomyxa schiedti]
MQQPTTNDQPKDTVPRAEYPAGVHLAQIRDHLCIRGGGLKVKGDPGNITLLEPAQGFEAGDYTLFDYAQQRSGAILTAGHDIDPAVRVAAADRLRMQTLSEIRLQCIASCCALFGCTRICPDWITRGWTQPSLLDDDDEHRI